MTHGVGRDVGDVDDHADPVHLAEAILQVKMDTKMRLEMAADSRKHWEEGPKWDETARVISNSILHH